MAAVSFEEFSVPPGSELALPPLFGGNILESELETEVEFADGGIPEDEEEEDMLRQQEMTRRKCQVLARRCKELEQVNERMLNRLHQVQRITLRLKQERRFLMRVLDSYGDDYRQGHLDIALEEEGIQSADVATTGNAGNEPCEKESSRCPPAQESENRSPSEAPVSKKRRRHLREEKEGRVRRAAPTLLPMEEFPVQRIISGTTFSFFHHSISQPWQFEDVWTSTLAGKFWELKSTHLQTAKIKSEEDFQCEQDDVLGSAWQQSSPQDKLLHYSKFPSPDACSDFD